MNVKNTKKANFIFSDFVLLLICNICMFVRFINANYICVAICFGLKKNIASLPGLLVVSHVFLCFVKSTYFVG